MKREQLQVLLGSLSGHLQARTARDEKNIEKLNQLLLRSLLTEDVQQLKGSSFAFENADLFSLENIPPARLRTLQTLVEKKIELGGEPEFRAFAREVPVRSTQLHASAPLWAGGAAVETTIGPFTQKDGRQFWFDFFLIEKLVALYIQNRPNPALLFKVRSGAHFISPHLPLTVQPATSYQLPAGSIWINSEILAANSPAGYYTGLTIKGGRVSISVPPQIINGKLTAARTAVITVELQLQQPAVTDADPASPYGVDARDATLQLPERFSFHFSGSGSRLDEISNARWHVFGHSASFDWNRTQPALYDNVIHRVLIPFNCSERNFEVRSSKSPFHTLRGTARISKSAWALPAAPIDIVNPTPASGIGGLLVKCEKGLTNKWQGLEDDELNLIEPYVIADPGQLSISDVIAKNVFGRQTLKLWKDDLNEFGTTVELQYSQKTPFFYFTFANGNEALMIVGNAGVRVDRPVTVTGQAPAINSKNSLVILSAGKTLRLVSLFDDNILSDAADLTKNPPVLPKPIALALHNALFKVTPVNGCVLFGHLAEDFIKVTNGFLYLTFGMYAYVPTLPDPYAANLGDLRDQFHDQPVSGFTHSFNLGPAIQMWLACRVTWQSTNIPANNPDDKVDVSFHFAPLQNQFQITSTAASTQTDSNSSLVAPLISLSPPQTDVAARAILTGEQPPVAPMMKIEGEIIIGEDDENADLPDYGQIWNESTWPLQRDEFALLDVSTNADLLGVSFGTFGGRRRMMQLTPFPLQVKGMDVMTHGAFARAFTVPPISWEPVFNLTPPRVKGDPKEGFNYYPDDGGPARILNFSAEQVALAPIPLTDFLVKSFANDNQFFVLTLFTLPFGLRALARMERNTQPGVKLLLTPKSFESGLDSGRQLELHAGESPVKGESNLFVGTTVQLNNVLEMNGSALGNSTLGRSVTRIFNGEFSPSIPGDVFRPRGVPVTRIDLSGYGASIFSNWLNPKATIAATSQAKFDVFVGRCAHEIIQVRSIMYPWGIRVVRTITLLRAPTNYVYRHDSGWQAESDGKFDFSYYANLDLTPGVPDKLIPVPKQSPYEIHPGVVVGLFNVKEIQETSDIKIFKGPLSFKTGEPYLDEKDGQERNHPGINEPSSYELQPVYFNADVEIENPISGYVAKQVKGVEKKLVPSKGILGFVQLAPRGMPIPKEVFKALIDSQQGSIGGPIDTVVNIANSGQQMRLNRFDVSNSFGQNGSDPIFVAAGRGNVILPQDGSWSLVKHEHGTGNVSPVPKDLSVPLIRIGKLIKPKSLVITKFDEPTIAGVIARDGELILETITPPPLLRIANPTELLRPPVPGTINYGFLLSTDTQKYLFLTPAFAQGDSRLLSKTPPLFADAFRLVNAKAIFPNIKDAVNNFGEAIALINAKSGAAQFPPGPSTDNGTPTRALMKIKQAQEIGYELAKNFPDEDFPLPNFWDLINIGDSFRIYIEYKADKVQTEQGPKNLTGGLNFNVNPTDKWKSLMSNVALVVKLGPLERLMTIKGNWDAKKGSEAKFGGGGALPSPQIEFSEKLQPVMDILEILEKLSGKDYSGAVGKGVKLAMSNKAGSWEYKFEAAKEIPVLRFPPGPLYDSPTAPFKLEAGLKLGAYFNSALKITTDKNQLLPSAGGFFGFYGRLSVMCVSLAAATVYAVGQVNLDFGADTKTRHFLKMKFGFGAQIVVGLPVIANVSVLFMVGVEIYLDTKKLVVSAFLLFQGHADILGGLVSVTITIEAKGGVALEIGPPRRTDMIAQVSFALEITVFWIIDITIDSSWEESRQIA